MVDVGKDPEHGFDMSHSVKQRRFGTSRDFTQLASVKPMLDKKAEKAQIDSIVTPTGLRAGVGKRGYWLYYREGSGNEVRACTNGERAALQRFEKTGKICRRFGPGLIHLFYREE